MKIRLIVLSISLITLFTFSCSKAGEEVKTAEWKGEIAYEGGVKVIKNPADPVFGDFAFDMEEDLSIGREDDDNYLFHQPSDIALDSQENIYVADSGNFRIQKFDSGGQYLQTIGKKGQGPGEFENPSRIFFDAQDTIYITDGGGRRRDSRSMKIFDKKGEFIKTIKLEIPISEFYVDANGYIFANAGLVAERGERRRAFVKMNSEGKIIKNIAEFSDIKEVAKKSREVTATFRVHHNYTPRFCFSALNEKTFSYGYPSTYQLLVSDNEGKLLLKVQKEETTSPIPQVEKKFIIESIEKNLSRGGKKWPEGVVEEACHFPPTKPFFWSILVDDFQRLYVWKVKSTTDPSKDYEFDVFDKEGYFLYRLKFPNRPEIIGKGFLFDIKEDEETGEVLVRRFRIKNWDKMPRLEWTN